MYCTEFLGTYLYSKLQLAAVVTNQILTTETTTKSEKPNNTLQKGTKTHSHGLEILGDIGHFLQLLGNSVLFFSFMQRSRTSSSALDDVCGTSHQRASPVHSSCLTYTHSSRLSVARMAILGIHIVASSTPRSPEAPALPRAR